MNEMSALAKLFETAEVEGYLHAKDLGSGAEISWLPDQAVVTASVFKIPILLELARRIEAGDVDPRARLKVDPDAFVFGPTGLSIFSDPVELSTRDAAISMMSVSDNTTTDLLIERLGLNEINTTLHSLGLTSTHLVGDCRHLLSTLFEDLGVTAPDQLATAPEDKLRACRALTPSLTSRSTPRETVRLLELIWSDQAGPPAACAYVREVMSQQVWTHRLRSGFADEVKIAAKTGTMPGIRNEAGVIEYPDGQRFAVAVFTSAHSLEDVQPAADAVIGSAARLAVDMLRTPSASRM